MYNLWLILICSLNRLLYLVGLRRDHGYWGIVYDSASKRPLDPAVVKLIEAKTGQTAVECVTDMSGRYSFLARPGRYKILVKKANYSYPSRIVQGAVDGIYKHLYHGELFDLVGDTDVVNLNIPLDPIAADWNQQAKKKVMKFYPFMEHLLAKVLEILFWFVFLLALFRLLFNPTTPVKIVVAAYLLVFILAAFLPRPRLWGRIIARSAQAESATNGLVELAHKKIPGVAVSKSQIFQEGKFFLRAEPGRYFLTATLHTLLEQKPRIFKVPVRVGASGVLNKNIFI